MASFRTRIPAPRTPRGSPRMHPSDRAKASPQSQSSPVVATPPVIKMPTTASEAISILGLDMDLLNRRLADPDMYLQAVRGAFKALAKRFHPDKNKIRGTDTTLLFQSISAARDILLAQDVLPCSEPGGSSVSTSVSESRKCPGCEETLHCPSPSHMVFRCPKCDTILRNPFYKANFDSSRRSNLDHGSVITHTPKAFLREWSPASEVCIRRLRRAGLVVDLVAKSSPSSSSFSRNDICLEDVCAVWRCTGKCDPLQSVCARIRQKSRCTCDHKLSEHKRHDGYSCSGAKGTCPCSKFSFHVAINGWSVRCRCKHTHRDHSAESPRSCEKGNCVCKAFESTWICTCGCPWTKHETAFHISRGRRDRLQFAREWVCAGVRPELTAEALHKRKQWVLQGHAPPNASAAAHAAVRRAIPKGLIGHARDAGHADCRLENK